VYFIKFSAYIILELLSEGKKKKVKNKNKNRVLILLIENRIKTKTL